jgi:transcriptional regulator with XRE-family HTH domain
MSEESKTLGEAMVQARKAKGLSQKKLAALAGYGESGVSIARIETGVIRRPSEAKLEALAAALGLDLDYLRELATSSTAAGRLSGPALRKANRERLERLAQLTAELEQQAKTHYEPLESLRRNVETTFLEPLFEIGQRVAGMPVTVRDEIAMPQHAKWARADDETKQATNDYFASIADNLAAQFAAGATAGGTLGAGAAFGAYSAVGAYATASTGTAISTLSGAAAANATMAALGGGSLAAGGFGVAGGTIVLGAIVAAPALLLGGVGVWFGVARMSSRESDHEQEIKLAEDAFDATARRVCATRSTGQHALRRS